MSERIKRHKIEEREQLTEDEKEKIAHKSDHRCTWCGKKVYFSYGATIDHYVPLQKGGTNDPANLVLMCEDCNKKKGSKVLPGNIGAFYLKQEYKDELLDYFNNYLYSYDYVSRGNLMACDAYELCLVPEELTAINARRFKQGKKAIDENRTKRSNILMYRAYPDDENRIVEFYTKYLKKYNHFVSDEVTRNSIRFWMRFGVVYFVEKPEGITVIMTALVNRHGFLSMNLFPYYATPSSQALANGMIECLVEAILFENDLLFVPLTVNMFAEDKLAKRILRAHYIQAIENGMLCACFRSDCPITPEEIKDGEVMNLTDWGSFITQFQDVEDSVQLFLYENNMMTYTWIADEILTRDYPLRYFVTPL